MKQLLFFEPNPSTTIRGFFQLLPNQELSRIPRSEVLRALRFYLSTREERSTATPKATAINKTLAYAVEINGGVEDDDEINYSQVCETASNILAVWEEKDPKLKRELSTEHDGDTLRSHDNPINFSRVGSHAFNAWFKPLPLRAGIRAIRFWKCHVKLRRAGFRRRLAGYGVVFWTLNGDRTMADSNNDSFSKPPLFIMHGIGFGCIPYIKVAIDAARRDPGRVIVLPEWCAAALMSCHVGGTVRV